MRKSGLLRTFVTAALICVGIPVASQTPAPASDSRAKAAIRHQVENYRQSIDDADTKLGATVWSTTPESTFIEPLGHEHGWDEIAAVVYGKLMGQTFSTRSLKNSTDILIHVYGNAAVVEFDWDFHAIFRADGKPLHTTGRESQVYINFPSQGWRLVHVHYSGPPLKGPGNGF